jgi:hypothetical protein
MTMMMMMMLCAPCNGDNKCMFFLTVVIGEVPALVSQHWFPNTTLYGKIHELFIYLPALVSVHVDFYDGFLKFKFRGFRI